MHLVRRRGAPWDGGFWRWRGIGGRVLCGCGHSPALSEEPACVRSEGKSWVCGPRTASSNGSQRQKSRTCTEKKEGSQRRAARPGPVLSGFPEVRGAGLFENPLGNRCWELERVPQPRCPIKRDVCLRGYAGDRMFFVFRVQGEKPVSGVGGVGVGSPVEAAGAPRRGSLRSAKTTPMKAVSRRLCPRAPRRVSDPAGRREREEKTTLKMARMVFG